MTTDTDSGLVERLMGTYSMGPFGKRDFAPYVPPIQIEAATRIQQLEADNASLTEKFRGANQATELTPDDIRAEVRSAMSAFASARGSGFCSWCDMNSVSIPNAHNFMNGERKGPPSDLLRALGIERAFVMNRLALADAPKQDNRHE